MSDRSATDDYDRRARSAGHSLVPVPIIAGTAMRGAAASLVMRRVFERHPQAFLITLARYGLSLPLTGSQRHVTADIARGLRARGWDEKAPIVLVGHSQGGLAALRYAIDHPDQVCAVVSVGAPWNGSRSAARVSRMTGMLGQPIVGLSDMAKDSPFLQRLHADLPPVADRITNVFCSHELFTRPYVDCYIDVPGVKNILLGTERDYQRHLRRYPQYPLDAHVTRRTTHLSQMNAPELRRIIWGVNNRVSKNIGLG